MGDVSASVEGSDHRGAGVAMASPAYRKLFFSWFKRFFYSHLPKEDFFFSSLPRKGNAEKCCFLGGNQCSDGFLGKNGCFCGFCGAAALPSAH